MSAESLTANPGFEAIRIRVSLVSDTGVSTGAVSGTAQPRARSALRAVILVPAGVLAIWGFVHLGRGPETVSVTTVSVAAMPSSVLPEDDRLRRPVPVTVAADHVSTHTRHQLHRNRRRRTDL